jgi:hypothetical protein
LPPASDDDSLRITNLKNLLLYPPAGLPANAALCLLEFWPTPVPLCRVAHDEAHHASRQHDLEVITVLHLGDDECQEQSDAETEHNAQRQRMHLASEKLQ